MVSQCALQYEDARNLGRSEIECGMSASDLH
jgi:hypothetical protein